MVILCVLSLSSPTGVEYCLLVSILQRIEVLHSQECACNSSSWCHLECMCESVAAVVRPVSPGCKHYEDCSTALWSCIHSCHKSTWFINCLINTIRTTYMNYRFVRRRKLMYKTISTSNRTR